MKYGTYGFFTDLGVFSGSACLSSRVLCRFLVFIFVKHDRPATQPGSKMISDRSKLDLSSSFARVLR